VGARATKVKPNDQSYALAKAKWQSSGLTDDHAKRLKLRPLSGAETAALAPNFQPVASVLIPYFDLNGKQTDFYRVRYLEPLPGFAGAIEKPQKYAQPARTLNEVYLPPLGIEWEEIAKDTDVTIHITEGEFKAACAAAHGLACIGLGGVDVWRSKKRGVEFLPALQKVEWKNRNVVIVFDSDAASNPNVVRAQRQLARELISRGAYTSVASLPPTKEGSKQGLDDFLVTNGADSLIKVLEHAPAFPEADALWSMNEEVLYVKNPGLVIDVGTGHEMEPGKFCSHHFSDRHYIETTEKKDGGIQVKKKPLARRWLEWEGRHKVERMTYAPGKPRITDGSWNTWPGWGCQPKKGDVSVWKWLLDFLFKNDHAAREWFEKWCAYPIQNPGVKMYSSSVIWGRANGTGKTAVAYALMGIYGRNSIEIKNKHLKGNFNAWQQNKQFIYGDEIAGNGDVGEKKIDAEWLKGLITQKEVTINQKFLPEYTIPDVMNYLFSSNRPDAFFLDDGDRRYMIHEVVGGPAERPFYERLDAWLKGEGPSYLFDHLLKLNVAGFNPREHAPITTAKQNMILTGKSDVGMWCVQLKEDMERMLKPLGEKIAKECEILSPSNLLRAYDPEGNTRVTANGIARELFKAGFRPVNAGSPVRTGIGVLRLYAIRNTDKWLKASPKDVGAHYERFFGPNAGKF
jgi:hypothetical protein